MKRNSPQSNSIGKHDLSPQSTTFPIRIRNCGTLYMSCGYRTCFSWYEINTSNCAFYGTQHGATKQSNMHCVRNFLFFLFWFSVTINLYGSQAWPSVHKVLLGSFIYLTSYRVFPELLIQSNWSKQPLSRAWIIWLYSFNRSGLPNLFTLSFRFY